MLIGLVVALGASIYLFYLAKSANVETLKSGLSESTRVYDESGEEVGKLFGQKELLWNWTIFLLIFKTRLFQLKIAGFINIKGIPSKDCPCGCWKIDLRENRWRWWRKYNYAQLAKNAYLTQEQTLDRKARELFLAIEIEKKYSKKIS